MVSLAVREYVLAALNVRMKGTFWSIEKLHAAPMPSMVVTSVPLELSDVDVKDGLLAGSKGVLSVEHRGELERLEARCLFARPARAGPPPGERNTGTCEQLDQQG